MTEYHPKNVDIDRGGEKGHQEFTNHSLPTLPIIQSFEGLISVCIVFARKWVDGSSDRAKY